MDQSALDEYSLRFAAFGIDADERNISAGLAELKLSDLDLTIRPFNAWLYLQDVNKVPELTRTLIQWLKGLLLKMSFQFEAHSNSRTENVIGAFDCLHCGRCRQHEVVF